MWSQPTRRKPRSVTRAAGITESAMKANSPNGAGRVLRGTEELRAFLTEHSPQRHPFGPTQISPLGDQVLVRF